GGASLAIATVVILAIASWPSGKKTATAATDTPSRPAPQAAGATDGGALASAAGAGRRGAGEFAPGRGEVGNNITRCPADGGGGGGRGGSRGPDLGSVGRDPTHTVEWLMAFIRDPKSQKPDARMPRFDDSKLSQQELRALAEYLASLK